MEARRLLFNELKNRKKRETRKNIKENIVEHRQCKRFELLQKQRFLPSPEPAKEVKKAKSRAELLKEWKAEREKREKEAKIIKKPPFRAGKVPSKATGSPAHSPLKQIGNTYGRRIGAVTRAQAKKQPIAPVERQVFAGIKKVNKRNQLNTIKKHEFGFNKPLITLTIPMSPHITKSTRKRGNAVVPEIAKKKIVLETKNPEQASDENEPPSALVAKPPMDDELGVSALVFSPNLPSKNDFAYLHCNSMITNERGNRRSKSKKFTIDEEINHEDMVRLAKITEFRLYVANETSRLRDLASKWSKYLEENPATPTDAVGDAQVAIGKTQLLTSDKFKQFSELIDKCEGGDHRFKIDDLQGFHDWVDLEVTDLDKAYNDLEQARERCWVAAKPAEEKIAERKPVRKAVAKPRPIPNKTRRAGILAHIMAERKKMREDKLTGTAEVTADSNTVAVLPSDAPSDNADLTEEPAAVSRLTPPTTPEPHTPIKLSPRMGTPRDNSSLRVHVLKRNTNTSGLFILAATASARVSLSPKSYKTEDQLTSPSACTPDKTGSCLKSILKSATSVKKSVGFRPPPYILLPAVESGSSDTSPDLLKMCGSPDTPVRRLRAHTPKRMLTITAEGSSDEFDDTIVSTPATPLRRSRRIASKSSEKKGAR